MDEFKDIQKTEKITVNLNVVELGYIDMLVNEGHYSNRTDFIKAAVRKQLDSHEKETSNYVERTEKSGYEYVVGITTYNANTLERLKKDGVKKKLMVVGVFYCSKEVTVDLLESVFESITVYGIAKCSDEIKKSYSL